MSPLPSTCVKGKETRLRCALGSVTVCRRVRGGGSARKGDTARMGNKAASPTVGPDLLMYDYTTIYRIAPSSPIVCPSVCLVSQALMKSYYVPNIDSKISENPPKGKPRRIAGFTGTDEVGIFST